MVDGKLKWTKPDSAKVADAMKAAAAELDVDLDWGGDWKSFVDTPHFQLDWGSYPKQDTSWQEQPIVAEAPKAEVKAAMAKSTKHNAAGWSKWTLLGTGGLTALLRHDDQRIDAKRKLLGNILNLVTKLGNKARPQSQ